VSRRLLCALGVSLLSAVLVASQAAPTAALSPALLAHVKGEQFAIVTSLRGLPLGVRNAMQTLFGAPAIDAAIAEPGGEYQATDVIFRPNLPPRRLVAAGCSGDHCLVYYERGGFAHTFQIIVFRWTPEETRFEGGGAAPGGLKTIGEVRNAVLTGAIKDPPRAW
jgi:hypothetical protein